jgi:hypothetical protein
MCMRSAFVGVEMLGGQIGWIQGLPRRRKMNQHCRRIPGAPRQPHQGARRQANRRLEPYGLAVVCCVLLSGGGYDKNTRTGARLFALTCSHVIMGSRS